MTLTLILAVVGIAFVAWLWRNSQIKVTYQKIEVETDTPLDRWVNEMEAAADRFADVVEAEGDKLEAVFDRMPEPARR